MRKGGGRDAGDGMGGPNRGALPYEAHNSSMPWVCSLEAAGCAERCRNKRL